MAEQRGRFITVEGIEGAGKSTAIGAIETHLKRHGISVVSTREPGGTPLAESIRTLLLTPDPGETMTPDTELLLMFAARAQHLARVIEPALARGDWVLCDRFTDATYAYQGGGRGLDAQRIGMLERFVQAELCPDRVILLDVSVALGLSRARGADAADRFERETVAFFERVRSAYLARAEADPARYRVIGADGPLAEVEARIRAAVDGCLEGF